MIVLALAASLFVGIPHDAPYPGEVSFCLRYPAECQEAAAETIAPVSWLPTIEEVDWGVNRWIAPMADIKHWDRAEQWDLVLTRGYGDCEDYALTKRHVLWTLGVPMGAMYLIHTEGHMRLGVRLPGRDVILDNPGGWTARSGQ